LFQVRESSRMESQPIMSGGQQKNYGIANPGYVPAAAGTAGMRLELSRFVSGVQKHKSGKFIKKTCCTRAHYDSKRRDSNPKQIAVIPCYSHLSHFCQSLLTNQNPPKPPSNPKLHSQNSGYALFA
ncbi:hypothetical protein XENORESO_013784, partial [Xenotaenia resolanae]